MLLSSQEQMGSGVLQVLKGPAVVLLELPPGQEMLLLVSMNPTHPSCALRPDPGWKFLPTKAGQGGEFEAETRDVTAASCKRGEPPGQRVRVLSSCSQHRLPGDISFVCPKLDLAAGSRPWGKWAGNGNGLTSLLKSLESGVQAHLPNQIIGLCCGVRSVSPLQTREE